MNLSQAESRAVPPVVPPVEPPATPSVVPGQAMHYARAAVLAPHEARAPTANLSPTKRAALLACVKGDGTLHKCMGVEIAGGASRRATHLRRHGRRPCP
jgi:hypothetical protein